jgi:cytochrome c oxidase assembly factor CtaG
VLDGWRLADSLSLAVGPYCFIRRFLMNMNIDVFLYIVAFILVLLAGLGVSWSRNNQQGSPAWSVNLFYLGVACLILTLIV